MMARHSSALSSSGSTSWRALSSSRSRTPSANGIASAQQLLEFSDHSEPGRREESFGSPAFLLLTPRRVFLSVFRRIALLQRNRPTLDRSRRGARELYLRVPPGYHAHLDPDVLVLVRTHGSVVARFTGRGLVAEEVERAAWEDYVAAGGGSFPRRLPSGRRPSASRPRSVAWPPHLLP